MGINSNNFHQSSSPIEHLATALDVAKKVYGIPVDFSTMELHKKQNQLASSQADQQSEQLANLQDPDSVESKTEKTIAHAAIDQLSSFGSFKKNPAKLGELHKVVDDANGLQVRNLIDSSPLLKQVSSEAVQSGKLEGMVAALSSRNTGMTEKNELRANKDYGAEMSKYEGTIQGANRVDNIIAAVQKGDLKATKTLATDLSSALGSMFNGGKPATVYGMSHQEFSSLYGRLQAAKDNLAGTTSDTVTAPQLLQLKKDVDALKDEYLSNHEVAFNSFIQGVPDRLKSKLQSRYDNFRAQAVKAGSSLENAAPLASGSESAPRASASPGAAQNMSELQQAAMKELAKRKSATPTAEAGQ